jgi:hypothetical protein
MPQFVTQMSKEDMEIESKKATLEAMKKLYSQFNEYEEPSSDSECESNSKLESRIHYMKLDIGNLTLELTEYKEKLENANKCIEAFKKIDNELAHLGNLGFYLINLDTMSVEQVKRKLVLFKEEEHAHSQLCIKNYTLIEFGALKESFRLSLMHKKKQNNKIEEELKRAIYNKMLYNDFILWLRILYVVVIIYLILAYIMK